MSSKAVGWALEQQIGDPVAKLVLVAIADHANPKTGVCWPSRATVAMYAECDPRTVTRKVAVLVKGRLLIEVTLDALEDDDRRRYELVPKDKRPRLWLVPAGQAVSPRMDGGVHGRVDAGVAPRVDTDARAGGHTGGQSVHLTKRKPLDRTAGSSGERRDYLDVEQTRQMLDENDDVEIADPAVVRGVFDQHRRRPTAEGGAA
ncbi:MAG: helix-turn-helix domain-containing protein [Actinomycetota bacterium]